MKYSDIKLPRDIAAMLKQQGERIHTSPMKIELSELQIQMKQYPFENFTAMPLQQPEQSKLHLCQLTYSSPQAKYHQVCSQTKH